MAKTDNTKQIIYDIKSARLDENEDGDLILVIEDETEIKLDSVLKEFQGQEIDFKICGAEKIKPEMFKDGE